MTSWDLWLNEFISLDMRSHVEGKHLSVREEYQHEYLRNLLEAALGTKYTLMEDNRRNEPRIPVALPVALSWEGGQSEAFTINLSWSGVQLDEDPFPSDTSQVDMRIVMEREGKIFEATGKIIWRNPDGTGIAFEQLSVEQKRAMGDILSKMLIERVQETVTLKQGRP